MLVPNIDSLPKIEHSFAQLETWLESNKYKAYDPGDGQLSYLRALTFGSLTLERVLTASVLRTPWNIRPLLGIRPHTSTKGMGYVAWAYLNRFSRTTGDRRYAEIARWCLAWLIEHRAPGYSDFCWGNDFTFTTRAGRIPKGEPTIVWSGLIGQVFLDAYETFSDDAYLDVARSICEWILSLPAEATGEGVCISYVAFGQVSIHNSNMIGGALLGRVGALTGHQQCVDLANQSMRYSCSRQREDGAWYYGEAPKYHWIDSFHTGYNLDSLKRYIDAIPTPEFTECLNLGYQYFKNTFLQGNGSIRYMNDRPLPIDIQCAAQAIDTLVYFSDNDPSSLRQAIDAASWTIDNMQSPDGYFFYRDLGWTKIRTPMFHWGQGTMLKALSNLLDRVEEHNSRDDTCFPEAVT